MELPELSGRTTCYEHKFDSSWEKTPKGHGKDCIRKVNLFDVQWSNCPVEVKDAVKQMWCDWELGNDHYFIKWDWEMDDTEEYSESCAIVAAFLKSKGFKEGDGEEILIYWWW